MDKSDIYLQEVDIQIEFAEKCFDNYKIAKYHKDIPEIFFHIHHFVIHVANIGKLLDLKPSSPRTAILKGRVDLTALILSRLEGCEIISNISMRG
jgi:hypothetical protein